MQEGVYVPILDCLSDHNIRTLGDVEQDLGGKVTLAQILQAVLVLVGNGSLTLVQDQRGIKSNQEKCEKLNSHLLAKARGTGEIGFLASPVSGGGIPVGRFQQLFMLAITNGKKESTEWALFAWEFLSRQGQRLVKEGQALESAEENLMELKVLAREFEIKRIPILRKLGLM